MIDDVTSFSVASAGVSALWIAVPSAVPAGVGRIEVRLVCTAWQLLRFWMQSASICIHGWLNCGSPRHAGFPLIVKTCCTGDRVGSNCCPATLHGPTVPFGLGSGTDWVRPTVPR